MSSSGVDVTSAGSDEANVVVAAELMAFLQLSIRSLLALRFFKGEGLTQEGELTRLRVTVADGKARAALVGFSGAIVFLVVARPAGCGVKVGLPRECVSRAV